MSGAIATQTSATPDCGHSLLFFIIEDKKLIRRFLPATLEAKHFRIKKHLLAFRDNSPRLRSRSSSSTVHNSLHGATRRLQTEGLHRMESESTLRP